VGALVGSAALPELEAAGELRVDRVGEARDLLVQEVGRELVGRELRGMKDLVRPGAADAGDRALVAEERVEAAGVALEDLAELLCREAEGFRAEVVDLCRCLFGREQPDSGALFLRVLREDELR